MEVKRNRLARSKPHFTFGDGDDHEMHAAYRIMTANEVELQGA